MLLFCSLHKGFKKQCKFAYAWAYSVLPDNFQAILCQDSSLGLFYLWYLPYLIFTCLFLKGDIILNWERSESEKLSQDLQSTIAYI